MDPAPVAGDRGPGGSQDLCPRPAHLIQEYADGMSEPTTATVSLTVPDISCGHCKRAIEAALADVPGVADAEVDVASRTVRMTAAGDAVAAAVAAIEAAGYDVPAAAGGAGG